MPNWPLLAIGILAIASWRYPLSQLRRVRARLAEQGAPTERIDAVIQSRLLNRLNRAMIGCGIVALALFVVFTITE